MLYLIRHGQTEHNLARRLQGRSDSPLTPEGAEQARRMGACLRREIGGEARVELVCSPLGRARRTAEIVREVLGVPGPVRLDERLAEIDVGAWEGKSGEEIGIDASGPHARYAWLYQAPGGEGETALYARLRGFLDDLDETDGQVRIVVSHGVAGWALRHLYCGEQDQDRPPQEAVFHLSQGSIRRVDELAQAELLASAPAGR